jgi:hypothetical protein
MTNDKVKDVIEEEDQKEESLRGHSPRKAEISELMKSVRAE